uniref:Galectin n=1 Tax=Leptobrachium leishanense TaxID=445787 RepID=A0A8C5MML1_9ANUR
MNVCLFFIGFSVSFSCSPLRTLPKRSHPVAFSGSFEIKANDHMIFSKLECGGFPYLEDVSIHVVRKK